MGNISPRLANDHVLSDQLIDLARRSNEEVERLARLDTTHEANGDIRRHTEVSPGPALDVSASLIEHGRNRPGGEHLEIARLRCLARVSSGRGDTQRCGDRHQQYDAGVPKTT